MTGQDSQNSLIGKIIERYEIQAKLGEGGMAVVYQALDTRLERTVALKLIRTEMFPPAMLDQILQRFRREATVLARMQHPNIVTVHDFGEYERSPYLVMEYLPGGTLRQRMGQAMPYQRAAAILRPVADALAYAHSKKIVHRDIKPANILFSETGIPKLSDFGIARLLGVNETTQLTATGIGVGTPTYMAPEQWRGQISPAVDMYALGVVFYEMLTGRVPYEAETPPDLLVKMATEPLTDPRQIIPGLPEAVVAPLYRALAQKPEERFATMGEFASVLGELTNGRTGPAGGERSVADMQQTLPVDIEGDDATEYYPAQRSPGVIKPSSEPATSGTNGAQNKWAPSKKFVSGVVSLSALAILGVWVISWLFSNSGPLAALWATATLTPTRQPTSTYTSPAATTLAPVPPTDTPTTPTRAATQRVTPTRTQSPSPTPWPATITDAKGVPMALIPAGSFEMGSYASDDENPIHTVTLDTFYIDIYEVTNARYAECMQAGKCPQSESKSYTRSSYYGNAQYADYPVIYVSWNAANTYCTWRSARLPTEAEWEKAARGGLEGKLYPWGDEISCTNANYWGKVNGCVGDTTLVGEYDSNGYGLYDMAGNVWEWVADWYDSGYYSTSPAENPQGPKYGVYSYRVLRGGSWDLYPDILRVSNRNWYSPFNQYVNIGFRCARSP